MFPGVARRTLSTGDRVTLVRIELAEGAVVPEHSHMHEQTGTGITGGMLLRIGTEEREVGGGDAYLIPGDVPHFVRALATTMLGEVFAPVREDFRAADARSALMSVTSAPNPGLPRLRLIPRLHL